MVLGGPQGRLARGWSDELIRIAGQEMTWGGNENQFCEELVRMIWCTNIQDPALQVDYLSRDKERIVRGCGRLYLVLYDLRFRNVVAVRPAYCMSISGKGWVGLGKLKAKRTSDSLVLGGPS